MSTYLIILSDQVCPSDPLKRTYRQINAEKTHYWLAMKREESDKSKWIGGYDEESLTEVARLDDGHV